LSSATVSVTDSLSNQQSTLTAADGSYTINDIAQGAFSGDITKAGYTTFNFSDTMTPGQTITIDTALDPSLPVISNIAVSNITYDSATITWTTDQPADSFIDYGITTAYDLSESDIAPVTSHSVVLTNLTMGTGYHFMVTSTNEYGFASSSGDNIFTTLSPITLTITSPLNGSTINRSDVMVQGTVINSTGNETGITINGVVATVMSLSNYDGEFFVNHVPLVEGQNTITANAVDTDGNTASTSITVTSVITEPYVTLNANIESGIAPLETYFTASTNIPNSVASYDFDYEGDSVIDYTGATFEDISAIYSTEGVYYPTITVTDSQSNTYTDTIAIVVLNEAELDALLQAKWEAMKTALSNQNVDGAVDDFEEFSKDGYREMFTELSSILPQIAGDLADIQLIQMTEQMVEYDIRIFRNGNEYSFYLIFIKDIDGIWRIRSF
ncbi:MAG TPA: hypothetical protein ENH40_00445, partial [Nitrospirae bacterium]|nr:hypothetical protein [Nitrospirota bacterium]